MKICTFSIQTISGPKKRLGALYNNNQIIDLNACWALDFEREGYYNFWERAARQLPSSLSEVLQLNTDPLHALHETYGLYLFFEKLGIDKLKDGTPITYNLNSEDIQLLAPLDKITSYRDFYIHEKHVEVGFKKRNEKIPEAWYEIPAYYKGATAGFLGPKAEILWPSYTDILDYELELGMIIGKDGFNIKKEDAAQHIFGFTILNDISARDIQKKEMAVRLGPAKGKDFCSIIGPVITTADEFEDLEPNLLMTATINGKEWSRGFSGDGNFTWAEMIYHVSQDEWVRAGDLFGSGTVGTGCGLEIEKWIKEDDEIDLYVEGIGHLINKVGKKKRENYGKF